jgi:hypothetical protein
LASGGGEVCFDGEEEAFARVLRVFADGPDGAGGGGEGEAAHRAVDRGALFLAKVAHDEDGQVPLASDRGQRREQRLDIGVGVFAGAAEVGADGVDDEQTAVGDGVEQVL